MFHLWLNVWENGGEESRTFQMLLGSHSQHVGLSGQSSWECHNIWKVKRKLALIRRQVDRGQTQYQATLCS